MPELIVILGPTASGKTAAGVRVSRELGGEVVSADSRQVYRGMDVGTGKDLHEYGDVPYHLIDILDPGEDFSVFDFVTHFRSTKEAIAGRGRVPVLVGGTGLYIDAVVRGYEMVAVPENQTLRRELEGVPVAELQTRLAALRPRLHNTTDLLDRERLVRALEIAMAPAAPAEAVVPDARIFGIRWERDELRRRITTRLRERLANGMVEEVEALLARGISHDRLDFYGLEYRYVSRYLLGNLNRNDMFQKLNSAIHDFAKKQETWFRRMERNGVSIAWIDGRPDPAAAILRVLADALPPLPITPDPEKP